MAQHVLRFISGKDTGREYSLATDREIIIGRASDVDLLLIDNKVSRHHAAITTHGGQVMLHDLDSRNGTFVNDRRIASVVLQVGDEVVLGSSRMRLVKTESAPPSDGQVSVASGTVPEEARATPRSDVLMEGDIAQIGLPDLIQMLASTGKNGVLTIRSDDGTGRIYFRDGHVYYATLDNRYAMPARKVFYRVLRWTFGKFELQALTEHHLPEEITESTTTLLFEGLRQVDEMTLLESQVPHPEARLTVAMPVADSLQDLSTDEIQIYKLAASHLSVQAVVDQYQDNDLEAYTCLLRLLQRGLIAVDDGR